jgi:hypothetical protein
VLWLLNRNKYPAIKNMIDGNKIHPQNIESFNKDLDSVLSEIEEGHYLFIIADRKKAFLYLFNRGEVEIQKSIMDPGIRKATKIDSGELHGRNTKLSNHIDNQLHQHLQLILQDAENLMKNKHINGIFLGGHQPLFHSIVTILPRVLKEKLRKEFITELNIPEDELIKHCQNILTEYAK